VSNVSSPGMLQQQRASLIESISSDISAVSIGHSGGSSTTCNGLAVVSKGQLRDEEGMCLCLPAVL